MRSETVLGHLLEAHRRIAEERRAYEINNMPGAASSLLGSLQSIEAAIENYDYAMYSRGLNEGRKAEQERFEEEQKREEAKALRVAQQVIAQEAEHA